MEVKKSQLLPNPAEPEPKAGRNVATGRVEIIVENMFVVCERDANKSLGGIVFIIAQLSA